MRTLHHRHVVFVSAAALALLTGCQKTEAEKFDEKFKARQSEIEARAQAMEAEADRMMQAQPDEQNAAAK